MEAMKKMRTLLESFSLTALFSLSLSLTTGCAIDDVDDAASAEDPVGCLNCGAEGDIRDIDDEAPIRGPRADVSEDDFREHDEDERDEGQNNVPGKSMSDFAERIEDHVDLDYCEQDADCEWHLCDQETSSCVVPFLL